MKCAGIVREQATREHIKSLRRASRSRREVVMSGVDEGVFLPNLSSEPSNAGQWRTRAEEMRTLSAELHDAYCRAAALRIAADYDRLADYEERRNRAH